MSQIKYTCGMNLAWKLSIFNFYPNYYNFEFLLLLSVCFQDIQICN
jgi:hypothetical protein